MLISNQQTADGRATWSNSDMLHSLKKQYLLTTEVRNSASNHSNHSNSNSSKNQVHSSTNSSQSRLCKNFNMGKCSQSHGHIHSGVTYTYFCSFCAKQGALFTHAENNCKKRTARGDSSA